MVVEKHVQNVKLWHKTERHRQNSSVTVGKNGEKSAQNRKA